MFRLPVYGLTAIEFVAPEEYVATEVRVPVLPSRLNDWIEEPPWLPTKRNFPLGSLAITFGPPLVPNGEPVSSVIAPSLPIEYPARLVDA